MSFFKFIFFIFLGLLLYNLVRLAYFFWKNARVSERRDREQGEPGSGPGKGSRGAKQGNVIELDKDQYKVE